MEILRVHIRKDGVKYCIIPKSSEIENGDQILVSNDLSMINKFMEVKNDRGKERRKKGI